MSKLLYSLVLNLTSCRATNSTHSVVHLPGSPMLPLRNPRSDSKPSPFVSRLASAAVDQGLVQFLLLSTSRLRRAKLGSTGSLTGRDWCFIPHRVPLDVGTTEQVPQRQDSETNHHPHSFNLGVPTVLLLDHNCGSQVTTCNSGSGELVQVQQSTHDC